MVSNVEISNKEDTGQSPAPDGGVEIHYVGQWQNGVLIAVDDFKFITK